MKAKSLAMTASVAVLFLFFLQLLSDFVGGIYALNLIALAKSSSESVEWVMTEMIRNIATSFILLSPVMLLFFQKRFPTSLLTILSEVVIGCRLAEPLLAPRARMLVSGLGVGCFLVLFPPWVRRQAAEDSGRGSRSISMGIALALLLSILLQTLGRGADLSLHGWFQAVGWVLGVAAAVGYPLLLFGQESSRKEGPAGMPEAAPAGAGRTAGLALGISGVVFLIYVAFSSPTVIARWTEGSYIAITVTAAAATAAFIIVAQAWPKLVDRLPRWIMWLWNGAFLLMLFLSITVHQVGFPPEPGAYPVAAPRIAAAGQIPVYLMLLLFPVILVDLTLLLRELGRRPPSPRSLGAGFAVASFAFLLLVFAVILTTIWAYLPAVGPLFRDRIHVVLLIGALAGTAPVLLAKRDAHQIAPPPDRGKARWAGGLAVTALLGGTILGAAIGESPRAADPAVPSSIKVLTYNIQAGVDAAGRWNFDGQLDVLRQERPDIIGLQESDTARITGGNSDVVRYLANRLGYNSYYGPKTVTGTFGIALLSSYPIEDPRTFYLWSEGEQTAVIEARIGIGSTRYRVFVAHLGNYGPIAQQRNILSLVPGEGPVILMGDFNFTRESEQYAITAALLEDCRELARRVDGQSGGGEDIDHIFVSPGTEVLELRNTGGRNSDHPAVVTLLGL